MTLANGRHTLAIPGPSLMPDRVLQAMHRAAPNIYTGEIVDLADTLGPDLKTVAQTKHYVAMYIGNGHAAWEASLVNVLAPGDKVLAPSTGHFSHGWTDMARRLGVEVEEMDYGLRSPIDLNQLEDRLRADKTHEFKAILVVQTDTSTSVKNDIAAVRRAIDAAGHPALLMVDSIACLGCDEMQMDAWGVDILVACCQKGLMTPPGMSFVFFNERADAVRSGMERVSSYWDWTPRSRPDGFWQYWCGTAPTHHLYGLREALDMIVHEEGIKAVWQRHRTLAAAVWAAFDTWALDGPIEMNIADHSVRSCAVTAVRIGAPQGTQLRTWLTETAGVTLGIGLGMATDEDPNSDGFFRVGHMGHLNTHSLMGTLSSIEAGLVALDIPHGGRALDAAIKVCAKG
jgi:alanine-glyoxylate transaminase/serine-glyoxylate transaminase/serine-pyruvate transaminase